MNSIKLVIFLLVAGLSQHVFSQARYSYDKVGNRTRYTLVVTPIDSINRQNLAPQALKKEQQHRDSLMTTVKVFPNPTAEKLQVSFTDNEPHKLTVYDLQGRLVSETTVTGSTTVDLSNQRSGHYVLEVVTGRERLQWKVLKQ